MAKNPEHPHHLVYKDDIAPLPPSLVFEDQQLAALDIEKDILDLSDDEMADLARRVRHLLAG